MKTTNYLTSEIMGYQNLSPKAIENRLIQITLNNSNYDEHRPYIGLSGIVDCPKVIVNRIYTGQWADEKVRLKCYKGYQMEADMYKRFESAYPTKVYPGNSKTISAHHGKVLGHPDAWLETDPVDFKSVLMDEHIPLDRLPSRVFWQAQGYMRFSKSERCYVIYESRESGLIKVHLVHANYKVFDQIDQKIQNVLKALDKHCEPDCECGKCK